MRQAVNVELEIDRVKVTAKPEIPKDAVTIDEQVLLELRFALRKSGLLQRFIDFRSSHVNAAVASRAHSSRLSGNVDKMIRVKNAAELFVDLLSSLGNEKRMALDRINLLDLLQRRTWLDLLVLHPQRRNTDAVLETVYQKLLFIDGQQPHIMRSHPTVFAPSTDAGNALFQYRQCALSAYMCGFLTLAIALLSGVSFVSYGSAVLHGWVQSSEIMYRSVIALFVAVLAIAAFQMITHISTPLKFAASPDKNSGLEFRVSLRRAFAGCLGPVLLGFGTGISASAGFGAFGLTVMLDGINSSYGIPFWVSQLFLSIGCFWLAWQWGRIPLGWGTLPALLLIGPAISFGAAVTVGEFSFIENLLAFVAGTLIFSFGIALTAAAALGPDGLTALSLAAEKKSQWSIPRSTFFFNIAAIGIGIALAGNFGVATALNLIAVPVLLHYQIPPIRRLLNS